jgi:hypothetical protein
MLLLTERDSAMMVLSLLFIQFSMVPVSAFLGKSRHRYIQTRLEQLLPSINLYLLPLNFLDRITITKNIKKIAGL